MVSALDKAPQVVAAVGHAGQAAFLCQQLRWWQHVGSSCLVASTVLHTHITCRDTA